MKKLLILLISFSSACLSAQCTLPSVLPAATQLEAANRTIAECFAPTVHQMAERKLSNSVNGRADLITSFLYDANLDVGDNWENIVPFKNSDLNSLNEFNPVVYYSVVWTNHAWVITYAFYHPRDYAGGEDACCDGVPGVLPGDNHENDLEGAIFVVDRDDFEIKGAYTISHHDLLSYDDVTTVPDIFIDNRGHAVEANIGSGCIDDVPGSSCDNCLGFDLPHVIYTHSSANTASLNVQDVTSGDHNLIAGTGEYKLQDIYSSDFLSMDHLRDNPLIFNGSKFHFNGQSDCQANGGPASAPWGWSQMNYSKEDIYSLLCSAYNGTATCLFLNTSQINSSFSPPILILDNPYNPLDCDPNFSASITIEDGQNSTWNPNAAFPMNFIKIESGGSFTIKNSKVNFESDGHIIIEGTGKLIIDNSTLTSCSSDSYWVGIFAENRSQIEITNNSIIENTTGAGVSIGNPLSYPNSQIAPTTAITITNTTFKNCDYGLLINSGRYSSVSLLDNITFDDCRTGIAFNTFSRGLKVNNSNFLGCDDGIRSIDSHHDVRENNKFYNCDRGVSIEGTFPVVSGISIGHPDLTFNHFYNNDVAIQSSGAELSSGSYIRNNKIEDSYDFFMYLHGANDIDCSNNEFDDSHFGVKVIGSGDNENDFTCNKFEYTDHASIEFIGDNRKSEFLENNFEGPCPYNIGLYSNANIKSNIGSSDNPAMNCFNSNSSNFSINSPLASPIDYHYFFSVGDCDHAPNIVNDISNIASNIEGDHCFGDIGIFGLIDPDDDGELGITPDFVRTDICINCLIPTIDNWIDTVLIAGGDDPTTIPVESDPNPDSNLNNYEEILDQWINLGVYTSMLDNDLTLAENILDDLVTFRWRKRYFAIKILQGDYQAANLILQSIPANTTDHNYFKEVQTINLKRFIQDPTNSIDANDIEKLKLIGNTHYPSSGYARSLLRYLTEIVLPLDRQVYGQNYTNPRSNIDKNLTVEPFLYPNPSTGLVYIKDHLSFTPQFARIYNQQGVLTEKVNIKNSAFDISDLSQGVYFIKIDGEAYETFIEKLIIIK